MKASDGRVAGFDGVRGISVLLVMCSHQGMFMPLSPEWAARLVPIFVTTGPASRIYWFQKFPQNFVLTFVVAALSWHLVEIHFLKLKRLRRASPLAEPAA